MAMVRQKSRGRSQVQIRRKGWPYQTATLRSKRAAEIWARKIETDMDLGHLVDQSGARNTTLGALIKAYVENVTARRPGEQSRIAETSRLKRFSREESKLCSFAVGNLKPEHFEQYRDRRLQQTNKSGKRIAPSTVKRELTLLKRVIDYRKRQLGLILNPVNAEDAKRPVVNDERDVRLTSHERDPLLRACSETGQTWLRPTKS